MIPVLGPLLFQYNWLVYFAIVLAVDYGVVPQPDSQRGSEPARGR